MTTAPPATDSRFSFDPVKHIYRIDGKIVPSVTGILTDNNLIDTRWFTEEARLRGTRVHIATHYLDEGDLDWNTVLPQDVGYIKSWELFKLRNRVEIISVERQVYDPLFRYAGTFDRIVRIHGAIAPWCLDLKTLGRGDGIPSFWNKWQLSGYERLARAFVDGKVLRRGAVVLQEDGSLPRLTPFTDYSDEADFLSLTQSTQIRRTHGRELFIPTE